MKNSCSRQNSWSFKSKLLLRYSTPSRLLRQSTSSGRSFFYCYKRHNSSHLSRRCTFPLAYSTASTPMRTYSTRRLVRSHYLSSSSISSSSSFYSSYSPSSSSSSLSSSRRNKKHSQPTSPQRAFSALFGREATISSATESTEAPHSTRTTLSFVGDFASSHPHDNQNQIPHVFHQQSVLFLFGFLFFPCWWIGALLYKHEKKRNNNDNNKIYQNNQQQRNTTISMIPVHPSLLANGRISSRILYIPQLQEDEEKELGHYPHRNSYQHIYQHQQQNSITLNSIRRTYYTNKPLPRIPSWYEQEQEMYHRWNKYMSIVSVGLIALFIAMFVWYDIGVQHFWWKKLY
ncbi:hypothetical protein BDC45DRAFT_507140 [Circinella umbellata]|nr:hypothetical protein BDC45DRAFT_507140 [Circinella umbellata]